MQNLIICVKGKRVGKLSYNNKSAAGGGKCLIAKRTNIDFDSGLLYQKISESRA